jgi:Protein of unknown function (DUF2934)
MKRASATRLSPQEVTSPKTGSVSSGTISRIDEAPNSTTQNTPLLSVPGAGSRENQTISGDDRIRQRAYELYVQSGYCDGHAEEHWFAAEREIGGKAKDAK